MELMVKRFRKLNDEQKVDFVRRLYLLAITKNELAYARRSEIIKIEKVLDEKLDQLRLIHFLHDKIDVISMNKKGPAETYTDPDEIIIKDTDRLFDSILNKEK